MDGVIDRSTASDECYGCYGKIGATRLVQKQANCVVLARSKTKKILHTKS